MQDKAEQWQMSEVMELVRTSGVYDSKSKQIEEACRLVLAEILIAGKMKQALIANDGLKDLFGKTTAIDEEISQAQIKLYYSQILMACSHIVMFPGVPWNLNVGGCARWYSC